jgi:hypothetical protein
MMKHLSFCSRIALLVIATCTTLAVALISLSLVQTAHRRSAEIRELRNALYTSYDTLTKTQVQAAVDP